MQASQGNFDDRSLVNNSDGGKGKGVPAKGGETDMWDFLAGNGDDKGDAAPDLLATNKTGLEVSTASSTAKQGEPIAKPPATARRTRSSSTSRSSTPSGRFSAALATARQSRRDSPQQHGPGPWKSGLNSHDSTPDSATGQKQMMDMLNVIINGQQHSATALENVQTLQLQLAGVVKEQTDRLTKLEELSAELQSSSAELQRRLEQLENLPRTSSLVPAVGSESGHLTSPSTRTTGSTATSRSQTITAQLQDPNRLKLVGQIATLVTKYDLALAERKVTERLQQMLACLESGHGRLALLADNPTAINTAIRDAWGKLELARNSLKALPGPTPQFLSRLDKDLAKIMSMAMQVKWYPLYPAFLEALYFLVDQVPVGDQDFGYSRLLLRTLEYGNNGTVSVPDPGADIDMQHDYFKALLGAFDNVKLTVTSDAEITSLKAKLKEAKKEAAEAGKETEQARAELEKATTESRRTQEKQEKSHKAELDRKEKAHQAELKKASATVSAIPVGQTQP